MLVPKEIPVRRQTWPPSVNFDFSCYRISSETTRRIRMKLGYCVRLNAYLCKYRKQFRSFDKFDRLVPGSDFVKFPVDMLVIASPPRPLVGFFFRSWSECSPQCLVVQVQKNPICRKAWPPSAFFIFLVIASPQKLLGGFE